MSLLNAPTWKDQTISKVRRPTPNPVRQDERNHQHSQEGNDSYPEKPQIINS